MSHGLPSLDSLDSICSLYSLDSPDSPDLIPKTRFLIYLYSVPLCINMSEEQQAHVPFTYSIIHLTQTQTQS